MANYQVNLNDFSGTIATGGTSQQVIGASAQQSRQVLLIQNNSAESLWVNFGVAAGTANGSYQLLANGVGVLSFSLPGAVPQNSVNIYGATTGDVFTCKSA